MFSWPSSLRLPLTTRANNYGAWLLWMMLLVTVCAMVAAGQRRSVTGCYWYGAHAWLDSRPLYNGLGSGFIYLPQAAVAYVPFAILPQPLGDILWRCLTISSFAWGIWRLALLAQRDSGVRLFPLTTLICLPLAWSAGRNGQATLLMAAMMMLAVADMADRRWSRATLWLCLGLVIKPLVIPLILIAGALHPAMRYRLAIGLILVVLFPLACQHPDYVWQQYVGAVGTVKKASQVGNDGYWAQLFGMLKVFHWDVSGTSQRVIRLVAAILAFVVCVASRRNRSHEQFHIDLFAIATIYLMLFSPRTENNTYAMLGPALGLSCASSFFVRRRPVEGIVLLTSGILILSGFELGRHLIPDQPAIWLAPVGCLFFSMVLLLEIRQAPSIDVQCTPSAPPMPLRRAA